MTYPLERKAIASRTVLLVLLISSQVEPVSFAFFLQMAVMALLMLHSLRAGTPAEPEAQGLDVGRL